MRALFLALVHARFFAPAPLARPAAPVPGSATAVLLRRGGGVARAPAPVLIDAPPPLDFEPGTVNAPAWVLPLFALLITGLPLVLLTIARMGNAANTRIQSQTPTDLEIAYTPEADEGVAVQHPEWFQVLPTRLKGNGLFCRAPIARGSFLFDYEGERIDKVEYDRRYPNRVSDYTVGVKKNNVITFIDAVDPELSGLARYMNHSGARPNVKMEVDLMADPPRVLLYAIKDIEPGDELVWNYGVGYVQAHPDLVEDEVIRPAAEKVRRQRTALPPAQPAIPPAQPAFFSVGQSDRGL
jgi:hypothetical protein